MKASVIVPNYRNDRELPAMLASLRKAEAKLGSKVEIVVVDDREGRGLSRARNEGLRRVYAAPCEDEEYIFFADADDTVREDFFAKPIARLRETAADICVFNCSAFRMKRDYNLEGAAAIREAFARAFLGIGWRDFFSGAMYRNREQAGMWRFAFRRELLEKGGVWFDEKIRIYEDAPFLMEAAIHAKKVCAIDDVLYDYEPGAEGIIRKVTGTKAHWEYKREIMKERERLDRLAGGGLRKYFAASQMLGRLEFLKHLWRGRKK